MISKLSYDFDIRLSHCDFSGRLGIAQCFDLFSDASTRHTDLLGVGLNELHKEGKFWMVTKTVVKVLRQPSLSDTVTLSTWASKPSHVTYNRNYLISKGDEPLVFGKSEWACMSFDTGKFTRLKEIFPKELEYPDEVAVEEPFEKIDGEFPDEIFANHTVALTDLDMNRHMNNARYAYAVMDTFSSDELKSSPVKSMEILYRSQAREGELLAFSKREGEDGILDIRAVGNGETKIDVRIRR